MKLSKDEALKKIEELKEYVADFDKKPEMAIEPDWGYKADLTEEFLSQTMTIDGVKYHRHRHGGGWVSEKARVDDTAWVGVFAVVHNGWVADQAVIHDRAIIDCSGQQDGKPNVGGSAIVSGSAQVYGLARVYGSAIVSDQARVYGSAQVYGAVGVQGTGEVYEQTDVVETRCVGEQCWEFGSTVAIGQGRV